MKSYFFYKSIGFFLIVTISISLFGFLGIAHADIAPPAPPYGSNPVPDDEYTNVRMISETVTMDISEDKGIATVNAIFTMHNIGVQAEQMEVRFPLYYRYGENCEYYDYYSSNNYHGIEDFKAWVNEIPVDTQTINETFSMNDGHGQTQDVEIACWANFSASFPTDKDVTIRVTYTALPYNHWKLGDYIYSYVLETGAGWKGTIGRADIIVRLPYELEQNNFVSCVADCAISNNTVAWHYEDFEPTSWGIEVSLIPPPEWKQILIERENTTNNPDDGEAWGRLGKAYKHAVMLDRGIRSLPPGPELYRLSVEAYQRAVTLLPNDADWHYGFAELLCEDAMWSTFFETDFTVLKSCVAQLKGALDINPQHKGANQLLSRLTSFFPETYNSEIVDLSGSKPDYLILTALPTSVATKAVTPTSKPTLTFTPRSTSTKLVTNTPETTIQTKPPKTNSPTPSVTTQSIFTQIPVSTQVANRPQLFNIDLGWIVIFIIIGVSILLSWMLRLYWLRKN